MEAALLDARCAGRVTRDMGGETGTASLVAHVLARCGATGTSDGGRGARADRRPAVRSRDALVVLDLQNDYCAFGGCFHGLGLIEPEATRAVADAASRLVDMARAANVLVVHVHTLQGRDLPATVRDRNRAQGRDKCVRAGSWGAKPFGPLPQSGEPIVVKRGYDPFLGTSLECDLRRRGVERLVVTGVFADVCVDALARTAYQLGFELVVARDATLPLERPLDACLKTMERYYNAQIVDAAVAAALLCSCEPETAPTPPWGRLAVGG
jgi:nicotinamidase-related amidase